MTAVSLRGIKEIYSYWREHRFYVFPTHPDKVMLGILLRESTPSRECAKIMAHVIRCDHCAAALAASLRSGNIEKKVPAWLRRRVRARIRQELCICEIKMALDSPSPNVYLSESTIYGTK